MAPRYMENTDTPTYVGELSLKQVDHQGKGKDSRILMDIVNSSQLN